MTDMSRSEAADLIRGLAFNGQYGKDSVGRDITPARVKEARRVMSASPPPATQFAVESLSAELVSLVESRLGMSKQRADLHVKGEVLRLQETAGSTVETLAKGLREEIDRRKAQQPLGGR